MNTLRVFSRLATISHRGFAAAAAAKPAHGADELLLTFSAPDKAFFNKTVVRQVDVPTQAGTVGILASHVPTIGVLKPGVVTVTDVEGKQTHLFVSSGTLAVNIDGSCQVLAEEAFKVEDIDENLARQELEAAQRASAEGSEVARAEAGIRAEVAEALIKAVSGH